MTTTKLTSLFATALFAMTNIVNAQNYGKIVAIDLSAQTVKATSTIVLSWPLRSDVKSYSLQRKAPGIATLTVSNLAATSTGYTDSTAAVGVAYEYKLSGSPAVLGEPTTYGNVLAGIEAPLVESRGSVLLVIASDILSSTSTKVSRLVADLVGEGWAVDQLTVNPTDSVSSVKASIVSRYNANTGLKSLVLIGHVPVPYSGNLNPDSHPEHKGAWPCDGFYGDIDGTWTDSTVNTSTAARSENFNTPGDGKYDQSSFPSALELNVGRIDFDNLPSFAPLTNADLICRYLDKNHAFRTGATNVERRGLVDDNLSTLREGLAASGRRSICSSVGSANMVDGDFMSNSTPSLFGTAVGYGSYSSIDGIGTTATMAAGSVNTVFNQGFGSYYGDWNSADNVLRGIIAANGVSLTSVWSGRPVINFYGMALGRTVGECVQAAQNQATDAYSQIGYNMKAVSLNLMGDPTLRLLPVAPVANVAATITTGTSTLNWSASTGVVGYHIYRADAAGQPFVRRNTSLVTATTFSETNVANSSIYIVKAVKIETTNSGTFFNMSGGDSIAPVQQAVTLSAGEIAINAWKTQYFGANSTNEAIAGDTCDADKDGVCNLVEYAMGTNPTLSSSKSGLQNVNVSNTVSGRKMSATFAKLNSATGVKLSIQCSSDLQTWNIAPATTLSNFGGYTMSQVSVSAAGEKCFFRVLVERI
jgi:hypothetical protein